MKGVSWPHSVRVSERTHTGLVRASCAAACIRQTAAKTPTEHRGIAVDLSRVRRFTVSTGEVDDHGTILSPSGWRGIPDFVATGSVLWHHPEVNDEGGTRDMLPIGRPLRMWMDGEDLRAEVEFASADLNPWAEVVLRMLDAGYISGISVGFVPEEAPSRVGDVMVYTAQKLVELSVTPLRSNPSALIDRETRAIDDATRNALGAWMSRALTDPGEAHGFGKEILTRSLAALKGEPMSTEKKTETRAVSPEDNADLGTLAAHVAGMKTWTATANELAWAAVDAAWQARYHATRADDAMTRLMGSVAMEPPQAAEDTTRAAERPETRSGKIETSEAEGATEEDEAKGAEPEETEDMIEVDLSAFA